MVRSPRWLRPHTVTIENALPEENWESKSSKAELKYVKVEYGRTARFSDIGRTLSDAVTVIIDANDLVADKQYVVQDKFTDPETQFTLRAGDKIHYNGREWEITGVRHINPLRNAPEFIEVKAE